MPANLVFGLSMDRDNPLPLKKNDWTLFGIAIGVVRPVITLWD